MVVLDMVDCIVVRVLVAAWKPARELKKLRSAKLRLLCSQCRRPKQRQLESSLSLMFGWLIGTVRWSEGKERRIEVDNAGNEADTRYL